MAKKAIARTTVTARFSRDPSGAWLVSFPSIPGAHTYGRTLRTARRRIPEVLELFNLDPQQVEVAEEYELAGPARKAIGDLESARRDLQRAVDRSRQLLEKALDELQRRMRLSTRDAGEILGISHQRVAQLLGSTRPMKTRAPTVKRKAVRPASQARSRSNRKAAGVGDHTGPQ